MHFANLIVSCRRILCRTQMGPAVTDSFDHDGFAALPGLAGPDLAAELARRVDEDLTSIGLILTKPCVDRVVMQAQSHILVSIAGTIGAVGLCALARLFNARALLVEPGGLAINLLELRRVLHEVSARVRVMRAGLGRMT